jgi:catalase
MPLPSDDKLIELSEKILAMFAKSSASTPAFAPAHGKGALLNGTFTPTAAAGELSIARHFRQPSTPVVVRFSDSTGARAERSRRG